MKKAKMQIELNNRSFNKDVLYTAITLRGGYTTDNYILDDTVHFKSNHAFYNILLNYFRIEGGFVGIHCDVQRATSTISFCAKRSEIISTLNKIFDKLFDYEYNEEIFEIAKQTAKDTFATHYKERPFRAMYKAFEFSDLNKCFTLKALINDIKQIDFESFKSCASALLVPNNVCVYIFGATDELDFSSILTEKIKNSGNHSVIISGYDFDPYLRQDAGITNIARDNYNLIILAFDFINPEVTNFTKFLIVEMLAEMIPEREVNIWVDSVDASLLFACDELKSFKSTIASMDAKSFKSSKEKLIKKYAILIENNPEHFTIKAANLMSVGIYVDQYLEFLDSCSYEMFAEICDKANYKITEAQIALTRGSK